MVRERKRSTKLRILPTLSDENGARFDPENRARIDFVRFSAKIAEKDQLGTRVKIPAPIQSKFARKTGHDFGKNLDLFLKWPYQQRVGKHEMYIRY